MLPLMGQESLSRRFPMGWIKNFECYSCGSTLGKRRTLPNGLDVKWCFACCAGDFLLKESEIEGLSSEEIAGLAGREWGTAKTIHKRLNTPGKHHGFKVTADHARYQIYRRMKYEYIPKGKTNSGSGWDSEG